jgi:hypothetical protein
MGLVSDSILTFEKPQLMLKFYYLGNLCLFLKNFKAALFFSPRSENNSEFTDVV